MANTRRWRRLLAFTAVAFLVCWLLGSIFLLGKLYLTGKLFFSVRDGMLNFYDFPLFYSGGQLALSEHRALIYDRTMQQEFLSRLATSQLQVYTKISGYPFTEYPPLFFLIMGFFALFPLGISFLLWNAMSLLCLLGGVGLFLKGRPQFGRGERLLFFLGCLVFLPTWLCVRWGQTGLLLLGLVCLYYYGYRKRRDIASAAFLSLATYKIQYLFLLVLPVVMGKRWKLIASFIIANLALLALCGFLLGWQAVFSYPAALLHVETSGEYYGVFVEKMVSVRGLLSLFLAERVASLIAAGCLLVGIGATAFLWRAALKHDAWQKLNGGSGTPATDWAMALTLVICLLTGLHSHFQDCVLLCLAAALTLPTVGMFKACAIRDKALRVWTLTLLLSPFIGCAAFIYYDVARQWQTPSINPFTVVNFVLLVSGLLHFGRLITARERKPVSPPVKAEALDGER